MPHGQFSAVVRYLRQVAGTPLSGEISDAELLTRFSSNRDEAAFELLLWRHAAMVLRLCRDVTRDEHAAEDAFQAVFLALACKSGSIRSQKSLGAWLYQTAYRIAVRARSRTLASRIPVDRNQDLSKLAARVEPGDELMLRELRSLMHEEVARLPAKYRCPVILCYFEGLAHEDAARRLGWPKGTVAGRLARAREMLRKRLLRRDVALPAALSAMAATTTFTSANPPALLIQATLRSGLTIAANSALGGLVSPHVAALTRGALQEMFWSKSKVLGAFLLCFGIAAGGVGLFAAVGQNELAESVRINDSPPPQNLIEKFNAAGTFHTGIQQIGYLALSPDGKRFAASGFTPGVPGAPGQLKIGGPFQERALGVEDGEGFSGLAFSPDGRTVAAGAFEGKIKLWDVATCRARATLRGKGQPVNGITFIDANTLAVAAGQDESGPDSNRDKMREVELWDLPTASKRASLKRAESPLAVSADGKLLATGTMDWNVCVWDVASGKPIRTLDGHDFPTRLLGFLPNAKELVTGTRIYNFKARTVTNEVKVWDLGSGNQRILAKIGPDGLDCGAVSPDGRLVALGSSRQDGRYYFTKVPAVTILEAKTGKVFATLAGDDNAVSAIAFSADSKTLAFATERDCVYLWNLSKVPDGK
jgi:RNA polymerase sigma factor (sigma-70 family)